MMYKHDLHVMKCVKRFTTYYIGNATKLNDYVLLFNSLAFCYIASIQHETVCMAHFLVQHL